MKNTVELVFILDKSGSMYPVTDDTIGGFNSTLQQQKEEAGSGFVTTVLFDTGMKTLHDRLPLSEIPDLTRKDYQASGSTALLDAVGTTIGHISDVHRYIRKEDIPEQTIFVIITDGMENASRSFTRNQVLKLIDGKKEEGWEFLFLGANIDAVGTAAELGIDMMHSANFCQDEEGIELAFDAVNSFIREKRSAPFRATTGKWKEGVEKDHRKRGGNNR